ncbi:MAG: helix-turn-helix transcriptional regulator [Lachnospiraceae bacterium]
MLIKSNSEEEKKIIEGIIDSDEELRKQHELFVEEMRFKQALIDARKSKELTQKEVSKRSGLSQQAVSRLEKGHGGTIDTVIKYLYAMGLTLTVKEL